MRLEWTEFGQNAAQVGAGAAKSYQKCIQDEQAKWGSVKKNPDLYIIAWPAEVSPAT